MEKKLRDIYCENACKHIGKGFQHLGRGEVLDCAGLLIETSKDTGIYEDGQDMLEFENYSNKPDGRSLVKHIHKFCNVIEMKDLKKADILLFAFGGRATHLGIYLGDHLNDGGEFFIHAYILQKKVVLTRFDDEWKNAVVGTYSYKNIDEEIL